MPLLVGVHGGTKRVGTGRVHPRSNKAMASEDGNRDYATFRFERSNPGPPLTIHYSISGSAIGNSVLTFADTASFY